MRIALIAEESAGRQALRRVLDSEHELVLVLSSGDSGAPALSSVIAMAHQAGLPVKNARLVREGWLADEFRRLSVDVLLNVHSLFRVLPEVMAAVRVGAFNLHPGPLPEYAGLDTVSWALCEGASRYGPTLHWMTAEIDAGPVAYTTRFDVDDGMTAARLMSRTVREGLTLLDRLLRDLSRDADEIPRVPQDPARRRYYRRRTRDACVIAWETMSAREVVGLVRACNYEPFESPWGRPRARLATLEVEVTKASCGAELPDAAPGTMRLVDTGLLVAALDSWVVIHDVVFQGSRISGRHLANLVRGAVR